MTSAEVGEQILDWVIWPKERILILQAICYLGEQRVGKVLQMATLQQALLPWLGKWDLRFLETVLVN